ncbi:MAG: EAL domain-containing protein [Gammaproteobacteria bacterium]|nr:EAL domain-containing protein [Gammaproteobacteria bacterium]
MSDKSKKPLQKKIEKNSFSSVVERIAEIDSHNFFDFCTQIICEYYHLDFACIAKWINENEKILETLSVCSNNKIQQNFLKADDNEVCQYITDHGYVCINGHLQKQFPNISLFKNMNADSFVGIEIKGFDGRSLGVFFALSKSPVIQQAELKTLLQVVALRAGSEIEYGLMQETLKNELQVSQTQLDAVPALMFMIDENGYLIRWNQYYRTRFGFTDDEIKNVHGLLTVHKSDKERVLRDVKEIFEKGSGNLFLNGVTRDEQIVPLVATFNKIQYEDESVLVGVAMDMTEQQRVEQNLLRSQGRLAKRNSQLALINSLISKLHTGHNINYIAKEIVNLLSTIQSNAIIYFSEANQENKTVKIIADNNQSEIIKNARRHFSYEKENSPTSIVMRSQQIEVFHFFDDSSRMDPNVLEFIKTDGIKSAVVIPLNYQNRKFGAISIGYRHISEFTDDEMEFYRTIGSSVSLAIENTRQYQYMEDLAIQDILTGLPNRNALNVDNMRGLNQNKGKVIGLILVDLDRFKEINDTLNHSIGDKLLKLVGPRISQIVSSYEATVYRIGGDEFCVLIREEESESIFYELAKVIEQVIMEPYIVDGFKLEIGCSVGVATTTERFHRAKEILRQAELAMYHAKEKGGGVVVYRSELDQNTNERFAIMAQMADAIRNNELLLVYQPKLDLKTNTIESCEALIRWPHKLFGTLQPMRFIPLVELTQLIHPLTAWVLKNVMEQIAAWKEQGRKIKVAVNLSTKNLSDKTFVNLVDDLMEIYKIGAEEIEFEVTETSLMNNIKDVTEKISKFRKRGIRCALDDYGTGYSSLSYIKNLDLDVLKIDRSFISTFMKEKKAKVIAKSTIEMAHNLDMEVVAEGVEDKETMEELAALGCDMIQGYFISEPLPADKFIEFIDQ